MPVEKIRSVDVEIDLWACFIISLMFLVLPIEWMAAWVLAAIGHELGHIAAVCALGGKVIRIRIGAFGALIDSDMEDHIRAAVCFLAGPMVSITLFFAARGWPIFSVCGFAQGCINFLPIRPMDGGNFTFCVLSHFFSDAACNALIETIENLLTVVLCGIAILCTVKYHYALFPMAFSCWLYRRIRQKYLAKMDN